MSPKNEQHDDHSIKNIGSMLWIGVAVVIAVFVLLGLGHMLGFGSSPGMPALTFEQARQRSALETALEEDTVHLLSYVPEGSLVHLSIGWKYINATYGAQELAKFKQKGLFKSYQPEGSHFLDMKYENGKPVYTGRFYIQY